MAQTHRILLLDDDPDLLDVYRQLLTGLLSQPEVKTTTSGAQAIAWLENEVFDLLLCDLKMPGMDGLQVLMIVRRRFPRLRAAVMTALVDETFRMRAYALGVDLYLEKPHSAEETRLFLDCIESLLDVKDSEGFRGLQTKGIADLLQLEVFSRSSSVLRVTHGEVSGKVWFREGQIVDAVVGELMGEAALRALIAWKTGVFDLLPAEPNHPRILFKSPQELLELIGIKAMPPSAESRGGEKTTAPVLPSRPKNEFVEMLGPGAGQAWAKHGVENAEALVAWADRVWAEGTALGEQLGTGPVERIEGLGTRGHLAMARTAKGPLCGSFEPDLAAGQIRERMSHALKSWNV